VFGRAPPKRLLQRSRSRFALKNSSSYKTSGRAPPKEEEQERRGAPNRP